MLRSGQREKMNKLRTAVASGATMLQFQNDLGDVRENGIISVDYEDYYVWSVVPADKSATVEAGQNGSPTAAHVVNSLAQINPRWSKYQILQAINDEILTLTGEGLFRMREVDLSFVSSQRGYDLSTVTDIIGRPYKILRKLPAGTSTRYWPEIRRYRYDSDMSLSEFSSGRMLSLYQGGATGDTIRVFYKSGFTIFNSPDDATRDTEAITGVPAPAQDILVLGACARLVGSRETRRSDLNSQNDSQRGADVPSGSQIRASQPFQQMRDRRVQAELARLNRLYPSHLMV